MAKDENMRSKTDKDLEKMLTAKTSELDQIRLDMHTKEVKDVRVIRRLRRQIAQIKTLLHERQLGISEK